MIELNQVTKKYGTKVAVERLSLHIPAGELFAFLGPNGAGKTTTIKLMCGLLFPTEGTIRIGGFDLHAQGDRARQLISYVPDQPYLYEKLTGREFLQFIADMYGMPRDQGARRIEEMIALFNLEDFVDDLSERFSHGMRQRTVFAAALLHQPQILIVDEPTVGLDPRSVRLLKDLLRRQAEQGVTVFLSTHSLDIAQELAARIGIVDHGRLIGCGTLETLRKQAALDGSLEEVFLKLTEEKDEGDDFLCELVPVGPLAAAVQYPLRTGAPFAGAVDHHPLVQHVDLGGTVCPELAGVFLSHTRIARAAQRGHRRYAFQPPLCRPGRAAGVLHGHHFVQQLVFLRRDFLSPQHPGAGGPGLRLQVPGGGRLQ
jgi:ABC-2 type transport system ATP-binding protein